MVIYKTVNLVNGKIYVGMDTHNNPDYLGSGKLLRRALTKYGRSNFRKEILEECTAANIAEREVYWIDQLKSRDPNIGYNITKGGFGGDTLTNHPDRLAIVEKFKQRPPMTEEEKRKRSNKMKEANPMHSPEIRKVHAKAVAEREYTGAEVLRENNLKQVSCPHCGKVGGFTNLKRWHFDNCKQFTGKTKSHPKIKCPHCEVEGQAANMKRWHFNNCKKLQD